MTKQTSLTKWPKRIPVLTPEEKLISDDWMKYWHEINSGKYSSILDFNHKYVMKHGPKKFTSTLEIGAGLGEHLHYESLAENQLDEYTCVEVRENMAAELRNRWPKVKVHVADCQRRLSFADGCFDRIVAIHVLEHLPDLPAFLTEAWRLLRRPDGRLLVVIPCEGGLAYALGRKFTSQRLFEKRYQKPYGPYIRTEHVNTAQEVLKELDRLFTAENTSYYPMKIPSVHANLIIGLTLKPRS